ncbi:unnamed protein product, partial [Prorocentrum cordatum]
MLGPGKGSKTWQKPLAKFHRLVHMWQDAPLGLHWQGRDFNAFILPALAYAVQFKRPDIFVQGEAQGWRVTAAPSALFLLAFVPAAWASLADMWLLRDSFGSAAPFQNLAWT